jgi:hypothetical protein
VQGKDRVHAINLALAATAKPTRHFPTGLAVNAQIEKYFCQALTGL